jgi:flagellar biosynthesis chaperone FliJ
VNESPELELSEERAATRFRQIHAIERHLHALQERIDDHKAVIKNLKEQYDVTLEQLLAAARDEADLPLLPWDGPEVGS